MSIFKRFFGRDKRQEQARREARARFDVERELFALPSLAEIVRGDVHRDMERDRANPLTRGSYRPRIPYYRATPEGLRRIREGHKYPRQLKDTTIYFKVKLSPTSIVCHSCKRTFMGIHYAYEKGGLILCPQCFGKTRAPV